MKKNISRTRYTKLRLLIKTREILVEIQISMLFIKTSQILATSLNLDFPAKDPELAPNHLKVPANHQ